MLGKRSKHCIVSLVERKSGYLQIGKLVARNKEQTTGMTIELIRRHPHLFRTITADNGTEFHGYADIERLRTCASTSPRRTTPGSAVPMRTPTA